MNAPPSTCIRGCTRGRRHLTDCDDRECGGCEPRRAEHGLLCWPCHRRFELMLTQAEIAERWLMGNLGSGIKAAKMREDHERSGGDREPPAPLNVAILDALTSLRDRLACWVDDLVDFTGSRGPDHHTVTIDAQYLLAWLSNVELLDWVGDWFEELAETMSDAHSVAPWRPAFTSIPKIPCPECHRYALGIFGGEEDVICQNCKETMTPQRYGIWTRMLEAGDGEVVAG